MRTFNVTITTMIPVIRNFVVASSSELEARYEALAENDKPAGSFILEVKCKEVLDGNEEVEDRGPELA